MPRDVAYFTCIDCSTTFQGTDYRKHTSCISEAEKYEKGLYKGKNKQQQQPQNHPNNHPQSLQNQSPLYLMMLLDPKTYTKSQRRPQKMTPKLKEILKTLKITKVDGKIVIE